MGLKRSKSDYRFLKILFKVDQVLAIVPWCDFENVSLTHPLFNKFQSIVYSTALTWWLLYSFCARQQFRQTYYTPTLVILECLHDIGLLALAVTTMLSSCLFNQNHWLKLNTSFQLVGKKLDTRSRNVGNLTQRLVAQMLISHVVFMGPLVYVAWCLVSVLEEYSTSYWAAVLCWYYFVHVLVLTYNLAEALRRRYGHLNEFLEQGLNSPGNDKVGSKINCIRESGNISRMLGEMVKEFNVIFGWSYLCVVGLSVVNILSSLDFFVQDIDIDSWVKISCSLVAVLILVSTSMVIMSCDFVKQESQKTISLCYKLQEQLPSNSLERKELLRLANIASNNVARFTAADFFELNRSTLCTILETTTTYFIIIIQFNNNTSK